MFTPQSVRHTKPKIEDIAEFYDERDVDLDEEDAFSKKPQKVLHLAK